MGPKARPARRQGADDHIVTLPTGGASKATTSVPRPDRTAGSPTLVPRPRLVQSLHEGVRGKLTMLTAPTGFGKSVLLDQWAAEHRGHPIVRTTLHPHDDPSSVGTELRAALAANSRPTGEAILVIDTTGTPENAALADALVALIADSSPGLHVVMASRSRWPTLVDRVGLAGGAVVGIDDAELAFTPDESQRLVRAVAGRELTAAQLEGLVERTTGWAAGLHLAAIALGHAAESDTVIETFGGDDRHVAGYLRSEVIERLPAHVRRFLERTSVLSHLSGPLCDALTGDTDGAAILHHLERFGVFTRPLTPGSGRFTYHRMFRELLRGELRRNDPDAERDLLVRAGAWHLERDEPERAATYFTEAHAWERMTDLVDRYGRSMFERGAAGTVLRWLDTIPTVGHSQRRDLGLRHAYLLTMVGDTRRADQVLQDAENRAPRPGELLATDALRATWAFFDASPGSVIRAADAVLEAVDVVDPEEIPDAFGLTTPASLRAMAAGSRARALWYLGDVAASRRTFASVLRRPDTDPPWFVHSLSALALLEAWAGNLRLAHEHARRSFAAAFQFRLHDHPATLDARLAQAHVARERGHLRRAEALLDEAEAIAVRTRRPVTRAVLAIERALWHLAAGRPERGLAAIDRNRQSGNPPPPANIEQRMTAVEARLHLASGGVERARSILSDRADTGGWDADRAAAAVQASVMGHDLVTARAELDRWPTPTVPRSRLERNLWTAIVDAEAGRRRDALKAAEAVVAEAEREGHLRLFLDAGRPGERLLRDLLHVSPTPYVRNVLRAAAPASQPNGEGTIGELSEREREVVRYLPTSLASIDIAARLYISHNTLKTHLRAIYRKLGVDGRKEAARRAVDLGLA